MGVAREDAGVQRIAGLVFIVVFIWVAVTVYTEGVDRAFGGLFSGFSSGTLDAPANRPTSDRAADAFQRAYDTSTRRVESQLERGERGE